MGNDETGSNDGVGTCRETLAQFSQRLIHVALTGKAFMLLPDGLTLLEHKLRSYRLVNSSKMMRNVKTRAHNPFWPLLRAVHPSRAFVFIASADVLEHFPFDVSIPFNSELFLIAHQSTIEVAEQHGVYLLGQPKLAQNESSRKHGIAESYQYLKRVLQKPRREEIHRLNAIWNDKNETREELVLTDSCYMIGHRLAIEMVYLRQKMGDVSSNELCCYRDFLCPLGYVSENERKIHFQKNVPDLLKWQCALWDLMHSKKAQLLDLGPQTFFHFGTPSELLAHFFDNSSNFREKFLHNGPIKNILCSRVEDQKKISAKSLLEWCDLNENCEVGEACILSGLTYDGASPLRICDGTCAITFPIKHQFLGGEGSAANCFITVAFHRDDDLKREDSLVWFGHRLVVPQSHCSQISSLWHFPLFSAHPNPSESIRATFDQINCADENNGQQKSELIVSTFNNADHLLSIAQVLQKVDATKVLKIREKFIQKM